MSTCVVAKFDGIDGCGKTTLINAVKEKYSTSLRVAIVNEFGSDQDFRSSLTGQKSISQLLCSLAIDQECAFDDIERELLWAVISRRTNRLVIPNLLSKTDLVLVDRSNLGNLAYGKIFDEFLLPVFMRYVGQLEQANLIFLFNTPLDECQRRLKCRSKLDLIESKGESFFLAVDEAYRDLSKNDSRIIILDGTKTVDDLLEAVTLTIDKVRNLTMSLPTESIDG